MRKIIIASCLAALPALAPPAQAQIDSREGIALQNQILELRQELQNLQQLGSQAGSQAPVAPPPVQEQSSQGGGEGASNDVVAGLVVRVSALEEQLRNLQGRISELANTEQHDHDDLAKQIGDLAFKLGQGGAPGGAPAEAVPQMAPPQGGFAPPTGAPAPQAPYPQFAPPRGGPAPQAAVPNHRTAELALKQGNAALARRDYATAEAAAREVLASGHSTHGPDAQYLLARAQLGQHQYKPAAATYYAVYKASPKSPRGAEGLLGVANSLAAMNDTTDACQAVAKFNAEFPHPEPSLRAAAAGVRRRAGCK